MKFAKELDRDAVPEWRIKYLNYKAGKKYIKAVSKAVNRANATPRSAGEQTPSFYTARTENGTPLEPGQGDGNNHVDRNGRTTSPGAKSIFASPRSIRDPSSNDREHEALTGDGNPMHYGSFVPTPTQTPAPRDEGNNAFELPAPALHPSEPHDSQQQPDAVGENHGPLVGRSASAGDLRRAPFKRDSLPEAKLLPKWTTEGTVTQSPSQLRRLFSHHAGLSSRYNARELGPQPLDVVRERESDFFAFLDSELDKVESFYRLKEEQAGQRLAILKEQLHEMRNRRIQEMAASSRSDHATPQGTRRSSDQERSIQSDWVRPIKQKIFPPGPNSKAFQIMPRTPLIGSSNAGDAGRDYIRRPEDHDVSYRTAKRKLKMAMHEFYRGLELLKSYALLNRTAFRKLNKKFDKTVHARPPFRYMNEKVNKAWFVTSDVLEGHIRTVEDLYARYFERGNQKLAAGKLRSLAKKHGEHSGSAFQSGFLIGTGVVFTVQGTVYGAQLLFHRDPVVRVQTSYLLQLYGGYFLMLSLFALFCVDCMIWTRNKINYPFIFEFDHRHHLDWRRLTAFPSFFLLLFGVILWANFSRYGPESMYLYYPVILIAITATIVLLPFPVLAHRARKWFAYSHWRLLLAGIYPVEFRDFFLGDIYCSLTYATSNIQLLFCLYSNEWENPVVCNSNHSRLMGFLAALPPIWRFLQCIRRYRDTRNVFPHLVNCGKYTMTIMSAVTLSVYRINGNHVNLALFITFSLINSIYCSIWDLFMDFSLVQAESKHFGLRDILALKKRWPYYTIMVIDPVIRFAWIFYAIFTHDRQHSTLVSFLVGFMEVLRRGAWALFRVENEHSANVSQYKASRDVPLPYRLQPLVDRVSPETSPTIRARDQQQPEQPPAQPQEPEEGGITASSTAVASTLGTLRRRTETFSGRSFSKLLAHAHTQDFQKKKRTAAEEAIQDDEEGRGDDDYDDDDEDDEDDEEAVFETSESELGETRRRGN